MNTSRKPKVKKLEKKGLPLQHLISNIIFSKQKKMKYCGQKIAKRQKVKLSIPLPQQYQQGTLFLT